VLVHGYSRVVVQALLFAANQKKRFQVFVTESRPVRPSRRLVDISLTHECAQYGLGLKTHALLTAASIDCVVILDSAVSFYMGAVDMCLVGAEAVCESGGLVNFVRLLSPTLYAVN
jgi:translation initiation factor eIF-2B subunit alpha